MCNARRIYNIVKTERRIYMLKTHIVIPHGYGHSKTVWIRVDNYLPASLAQHMIIPI